MFIGRTKELAMLSKRWQAQKFECIVIYGRRRVGKTALISQFCQGKPCVFFTGLESSASENLRNLSRSIYEAGGNSGDAPVYRDFEAAFVAIAELGRNRQIAVVIDEYEIEANCHQNRIGNERSRGVFEKSHGSRHYWAGSAVGRKKFSSQHLPCSRSFVSFLVSLCAKALFTTAKRHDRGCLQASPVSFCRVHGKCL